MNIDFDETEKQIDWLKQVLALNALPVFTPVKRGGVYTCDLGCGVCNEMQKTRPCVVVQNDIGNNHSNNTIVVPITHGSALLPTVVKIERKTDSFGNTILDGWANVSDIKCVSKARIKRYICDLPTEEMRLIDEALAKSLEIMRYYATLKTKISKQEEYVNKVKEERNFAQDELREICKIVSMTDNPNEAIIKIKKILNCA